MKALVVIWAAWILYFIGTVNLWGEAHDFGNRITEERRKQFSKRPWTVVLTDILRLLFGSACLACWYFILFKI